MGSDTVYRLRPGVCYRKSGQNVYVRDVNTRRDYMFNPIVRDIFDILCNARTRDELMSELSKEYDVESDPPFVERLDRFLQQMSEKGALEVIGAEDAVDSEYRDAECQARGTYQRETKLWNVCLELTYACNERCRHCYLDDESEIRAHGVVGWDVYRKAIDEISSMGCMNVLVTGGEPTLHPDFVKICRYITERRMLLDVFTNGLEIPDAVFDELVGMRPNTVSFSLYGGNAEFHDSVTRVPGSFNRSLRTLMMFKCAGVDVYIKSVLFKGHAKDQRELRDLAKRITVPVVCGQTVANGHSGKVQTELEPDDDTLAEYFGDEAKVDPFWKSGVEPLRNVDLPICGVGFSTLTIRPNGDISPCIKCRDVIGNAARDSIPRIWKTSQRLADLRTLRFRDISSRCASCEDIGFCHVCPGVSFDEQGGLAPCGYSCRHAKLKHRVFDFHHSQSIRKETKHEKEG